ncbi:MAG: hypothetical protein HQK50_00595 [Oligoflexia bacterium]|nr:hypothetical protein [Oligoflexia bacterium]MBF0364033.1 hypothetical protein [Oligoflexia bacterium]
MSMISSSALAVAVPNGPEEIKAQSGSNSRNIANESKFFFIRQLLCKKVAK